MDGRPVSMSGAPRVPGAARTPAPSAAPDGTPLAELVEKYRGQYDIIRVDEGVSFVAVERVPGRPQPAIILAGSVGQLDRQLEGTVQE